MDAFGEELNTLLSETYRSVGKIEEIMLRDLSDGKLSLGEMHTIECVGVGREKGKTVTELSQEMNITLPSVTAMIKRLEKKGYIVKAKDPDDGRSVRILLPDAGRRAAIGHRFFHRKVIYAMRAELDETEREVLLKSVRRINDFIRLKLIELQDGDKGE